MKLFSFVAGKFHRPVPAQAHLNYSGQLHGVRSLWKNAHAQSLQHFLASLIQSRTPCRAVFFLLFFFFFSKYVCSGCSFYRRRLMFEISVEVMYFADVL